MITVKKRYKSIFIVIVTIAVILYGIGYYLNVQLNNFVVNLSERITEEIALVIRETTPISAS